MITKKEAETIVLDYLSKQIKNSVPIIDNENTVEWAYGWVFFYKPEESANNNMIGKCVESHDSEDLDWLKNTYVGGAPILINKETKELVELRPVNEWKKKAKRYERMYNLKRLF